YNTLSELKDESFQPKATFFVVGNNIGLNTYLTEEEIKKVSDSDIISIQSHTMNHEHFNDAEVAEKVDIHEEIAESKMLLEEITGKRVSTLAYPYGAYNPNVIEETKKEYDYAVTTTYGIADLNDSHYELKRVRISFDTTIEQFS